MDAVLMTVPPGIAPRTRGGDWGVVMFHTSGKGEKTQWFDFRHSMYDSPVHAEWPLGSMMATLPAEIAEVLVEHRYARVMTLEEAKQHNKRVEKHIDATTGVQLNVS